MGYSNHFRQLLGALFKAQPMVALDEFLGGPPEETRNLVRRVDFIDDNPMGEVPLETLIAWAQIDPLPDDLNHGIRLRGLPSFKAWKFPSQLSASDDLIQPFNDLVQFFQRHCADLFAYPLC